MSKIKSIGLPAVPAADTPTLYGIGLLGRPRTRQAAAAVMHGIVRALSAWGASNTMRTASLDPTKYPDLASANQAIEQFLTKNLGADRLQAWSRPAAAIANDRDREARARAEKWISRALVADSLPLAAKGAVDDTPHLRAYSALADGTREKEEYRTAHSAALFRETMLVAARQTEGSSPVAAGDTPIASALARYEAFQKLPVGAARQQYYALHAAQITEGAKQAALSATTSATPSGTQAAVPEPGKYASDDEKFAHYRSLKPGAEQADYFAQHHREIWRAARASGKLFVDWKKMPVGKPSKPQS